jgi:hypothetical protein
MVNPLEPRIIRLDAISDVREALARIEERQAAMMETTATAAQLTQMRGELSSQMAESLDELSGQIQRLWRRVESLPTVWTMVTAIVAGQAVLAGLIAAVAFGVVHIMGLI